MFPCFTSKCHHDISSNKEMPFKKRNHMYVDDKGHCIYCVVNVNLRGMFKGISPKGTSKGAMQLLSFTNECILSSRIHTYTPMISNDSLVVSQLILFNCMWNAIYTKRTEWNIVPNSLFLFLGIMPRRLQQHAISWPKTPSHGAIMFLCFLFEHPRDYLNQHLLHFALFSPLLCAGANDAYFD